LPEIAQYANRKMLKEAQQCFETAIAKNLANSHTYTIMINAHVRCGDADGAAKVLKRMSKASLQPCVVASGARSPMPRRTSTWSLCSRRRCA